VRRYEAEQLLLAVLLSIGGLGVAASIVLGGLIWKPSARQP
jgi:hypothetical protein